MEKKITLLVSILFWSTFSVMYAGIYTIREENTIASDNNVIFEIIPKQAQVVIDGIQKYSIYEGKLALKLSQGEHSYEVLAPNYESIKGKMEIAEREVLKLTVTLERLNSGSIDIATFPDDVEIIYKNHKYMSVLELDSLSIGNHSFSFVKDGYFPIDTTFAIKNGVTSFHSVVLSPVKPTIMRQKSEKQTWDILTLAQGGYNQDLSLGLMIGIMKKNGIYIKGMVSLDFTEATYICNKTGAIQRGSSLNYPYYKKDAYSHPRYSVSAGYLRELWKPLIFYIGTGYGSRKTLWETIAGEKVENEGLHTSGIIAECGAIFRLNWLVASCGIQSVDFSYNEIQFGLGIIF